MDETIIIQALAYGAEGVGKSSAGKTVFVEGAAPGDRVKVDVIEEKKHFNRARIKELLEPGASRVHPPCPYAGVCGGCPWQHVSYQKQLEAKRQTVLSSLTRIAKIDQGQVEEILAHTKPSKREFGYRNKIELQGSLSPEEGFVLGFRAKASPDIIPIDACLLAAKHIETSPKALRGALRYLHGKQDLGIFRVGIRHSMRTRDTELALWTTPGSFPRKAISSTCADALQTTSLVRVVSEPEKARRVKQVEVLQGKGFWEESLAGSRFKTSAPSFFQVNTAQAEVLVDAVVEGLSLNAGSRVADLYAGGGTFSVALAKKTKHVIAVEAASSSVQDLRRNASLNHATIDVRGGDSGRELANLGRLDALVVDPPRAGLSRHALTGIIAAQPRDIAYVSCDPATLARDVARLREGGYRLTHVQPIDLFPQTYHVECVVGMSRVK